MCEGSPVEMPRDDSRLQQHINDLEVKRRDLKVLNEFAISLMTIPTVDELLWHVAREVVGKLGFVDCVVYQHNAVDNQLLQVAASGDKNPEDTSIANRLVIPVGSGITGTVAKSKLPVIVEDVTEDPRYISDLQTSRSEICVPIIVNDELYGVIDCEDPCPDRFDENHLELLTTVASLTSSKIVQCRTLEGFIDQAKVLRRVTEIIIAIEPDGTIIDCNPAAETAYGMSREELTGVNISSLHVARDEGDTLLSDLIDHEKRGEAWSGRLPITDRFGEDRDFDISVTPISAKSGKRKRFVIIGRDVTKQVAVERSLQERNQVLQDMGFELRDALEQSRIAQRTQAAFLANVSHELRTPLNAIVGFSDIMTNTDLLAKSPEKALEYNQYIHSAGQHLTSLVNDILNISSLAANESEASRDQIDVNAALEGCRTLINHKAQRKQIEIEFKAHDETQLIIFDDRHFKQIMTNLLDNAIKFSPEESSVTIKIEHIEQQGLEISVSDQGRGIEESQIENIFTAFSRADWVRSQDVEGAGLGLALVSEMVSINGSEIGIASEPGNGATFTLHIPADRVIQKKQSAS